MVDGSFALALVEVFVLGLGIGVAIGIKIGFKIATRTTPTTTVPTTTILMREDHPAHRTRGCAGNNIAVKANGFIGNHII